MIGPIAPCEVGVDFVDLETVRLLFVPLVKPCRRTVRHKIEKDGSPVRIGIVLLGGVHKPGIEKKSESGCHRNVDHVPCFEFLPDILVGAWIRWIRTDVPKNMATGDDAETTVVFIHITKRAPDIETEVAGVIDQGKILMEAQPSVDTPGSFSDKGRV